MSDSGGTKILLEETPWDEMNDSRAREKIQEYIIDILKAEDIPHSPWMRWGPIENDESES